ncbi:calcineurin-like phosphoesterase [Pseudomassariella vexata]|uniref:Calcineurin-like phosphoesterase n=1 Tax=Pseudomassariella vexata TaxID=1141098 RepID=A0A1Y2E998_9PEZI|nr:calcineurin-like phosphoesterase [Pseudomassariella vexata]ORY67435.1 calcineurin-like phosphoesterase [Pseudomassariella vexata]
MVACLPIHLIRRRMVPLTLLLLVTGTLYLCYVRFDQMPMSAQGFLSKAPFDASSSKSETSSGDNPSTPNDAATEQITQTPMSYGTYGRPPLKNLIPLRTLSTDHLPTPSTSSPHLIIIGDVHGQLSELKALLTKAGYSKTRGDHVIFTGDLVAKGPDSSGVVALAMEIGASAVRGNHEDRVLLAYENMNTLHVGTSDEQEEPVAAGDQDDMAEPAFSHGDYKARSVAQTLTSAQRSWLSQLPVILKLGRIPSYGDMVVVHAGLVPNIPLENQDPWAVMNMRTLVYPAEQVRREQIKKQLEEAAKKSGGKQKKIPDSEVDAAMEASRQRGEGTGDHDVALPIDGRDGQFWSEAWNEAQKELDARDRINVVYGHDAKTGLNLGKYTYGLDSSCVKGGQLTALVFEPGRAGKVTHRVVSVSCEAAKDLEKGKDDDSHEK